MTDATTAGYDDLLARARNLAHAGGRSILGIVGAPGAGKSTLGERLVSDLEGAAVLVPMDGFHLADAQLTAQGTRDVKGAPHTFDDAGYAALLERLARPRPDETVYAPAFDRTLEEPVAGSIAVPPDVSLVVTEGNYLLLDSGHWPRAAACLTESWFLDLDPDVRLERLVARHVRFGKTPDDARAWALGTDEANARTIAATAPRADLRVVLAPAPGASTKA